ncbi:MAG: HAD-IIB family hydrolase [bacterium]
MKPPQMVIFTDLDETLLDYEHYRFAAALPALRQLKSRNIPLILNSSKTSAEIKQLRVSLDNRHPYVAENGAAIFIPEDYFNTEFPFQKRKSPYLMVEMGTPYRDLRKALEQIKRTINLPIVGFGDLTPQDLKQLTGLSLEEAELALQRQYDEPFFVEGRAASTVVQELSAIVSELGLHLTTGGRFFHLMGNNDKGRAVKILHALFEKDCGPVRTVGLGDSLNDLPLLQAVDEPILVQKPNRVYDQGVLDQIKPTLAPGVGPVGWNNAVIALLRNSGSRYKC